jgi:hypothetical protein
MWVELVQWSKCSIMQYARITIAQSSSRLLYQSTRVSYKTRNYFKIAPHISDWQYCKVNKFMLAGSCGLYYHIHWSFYMDSFEPVLNISVSKRSIEDSLMELILPVHVLHCLPKVLRSSGDSACITFLVIVLGFSSSRDHAHIMFLVISFLLS